MIKIVKKSQDTKKTNVVHVKSVNAATAWELDFKRGRESELKRRD